MGHSAQRALTTEFPPHPRTTGTLRAVQLLLGHTKIENTVRYLGIEVDDALAIADGPRHLCIEARARRARRVTNRIRSPR